MFDIKKYVENKKEGFRQEIRRQEREKVFNIKRLRMNQETDNNSITYSNIQNLVSQIYESSKIYNNELLLKLHQEAFQLVSQQQNTIQAEEFIKCNYLKYSLYSLNVPQLQYYVIRVLVNLSQQESFYQQQSDQILISLNVAANIINNQSEISQISDTLMYIGNLCSKSTQISQLFLTFINRFHFLSQTNQDINLYKNICFCIYHIFYALNDQLSIKQRIQGLQILIIGVNRDDCDMLNNEILSLLSIIYQPKEEIDLLIIKSPLITYTLNVFNEDDQEIALKVLKQFSLTESREFANLLIDLNILDQVFIILSSKKKIIKKLGYLIIINLAYNDDKITNRILQHNIMNKIFNLLITTSSIEKQNCIKIILNLLKTGNNEVYQKIIQMGIIQIINNLLDDGDINLIKLFLDVSCRLLQFAKEQRNIQMEEQIKQLSHKFDFYYQECKDPKFIELYITFISLA